MGCQHLWQQRGLECPYGFKLPFDVTWPDEDRAESFGLEGVQGNVVWILLNVAYSYVPLAIMTVQFVRLLLKRGTRELCILTVLVFTFFLNEGILKHLIQSPRPEMSCCTSCGMPSSHSAFSASMWGFHMFELGWRLKLSPYDWEEAKESAQDVVQAAQRPWDELHSVQCLLLFCWWSLLLVPVPFSRVILGDHSPPQVAVGSLVGLCSSTAVWLLARQLQKSYNNQLDTEQICRGHRCLIHNMALPITSLRRRLESTDRRELLWYIHRLSAQLECCDGRPYLRRRLEETKSSLESALPAAVDFRELSSLERTPSWPMEAARFVAVGEALSKTVHRVTDAASAPASMTEDA